MTTFVGKYLNPGEVESLIKTEKDGRRKMRLNQVRQQARINASKIAAAVKRERKKQLYILANSLKAEWLKNKNEQIEELGQLYGESLNLVGTAHSNVCKEAIYKEALAAKLDENDSKATVRGVEALQEMQTQKLKEQEFVKKQEEIRRKVRTVENDRARQISALPVATPKMIPVNKVSIKPDEDQSIDESRIHNQKSNSTAPANNLVKVIKENLDDKVIDAHSAAKLEETRQAEVAKKKILDKVNQSKKEHTRFLNAKSQMELQQDFNRIMNELEELSKQEQICNEPHLLIELQNDNEQLKQEQEAIVEELFSRLGLSLTEPVYKDSEFTSIMQHSTETQKSETSESDVTPVVYIVVQDPTLTEATSSSSRTHSLSPQDSQTVTNSYPLDSEADSSDTAKISSRWSRANVDDGSVDKFSISEAIKIDETILAGHFNDHSTADIPVLPSSDFDSSNSPASLPIPHRDVYKTMANGMHGHESFTGVMDTGVHSFRQDTSSRKNNFPLKHYSHLENQNASLVQTSSPVGKDDTIDRSKDTNNKPSTGDNNFKMLAVTNVLTNKEQSINSAKSPDSTKEFFNVQVRHAISSDYYEQQNTSKQKSVTFVSHDTKDLHNPVISALPANSDLLTKKLAMHSTVDGSQRIVQLDGSIAQASDTISKLGALPPISRFRANSDFFDPLKNLIESPIESLIPDSLYTLIEDKRNQYSNVDKLQQGKYQLIARDLSTIVEMDTPNSSMQTCWLDSTTDLNGITDEPNLTLVSSNCSTCSPDQSSSFAPSYIISSHTTFEHEQNVMGSRQQKVIKEETPFHLISTKRTKVKDLHKVSITGNFPPAESPPFTSFETSDSKSTPTLSSGESHSCLSGKSQKSFSLPSVSSSGSEFFSGMPYPLPVRDPSFDKFSSKMDSARKGGILSKSTFSTFDLSTSIHPSSTATELLSFIDCAQLSTTDKRHDNVDSLTGDESTFDSRSSKINSATESGRRSYFSSPNESISDSMFSFLKHELSANSDNSSLSLIYTSATNSH